VVILLLHFGDFYVLMEKIQSGIIGVILVNSSLAPAGNSAPAAGSHKIFILLRDLFLNIKPCIRNHFWDCS